MNTVDQYPVPAGPERRQPVVLRWLGRLAKAGKELLSVSPEGAGSTATSDVLEAGLHTASILGALYSVESAQGAGAPPLRDGGSKGAQLVRGIAEHFGDSLRQMRPVYVDVSGRHPKRAPAEPADISRVLRHTADTIRRGGDAGPYFARYGVTMRIFEDQAAGVVAFAVGQRQPSGHETFTAGGIFRQPELGTMFGSQHTGPDTYPYALFAVDLHARFSQLADGPRHMTTSSVAMFGKDQGGAWSPGGARQAVNITGGNLDGIETGFMHELIQQSPAAARAFRTESSYQQFCSSSDNLLSLTQIESNVY